MGKITCPDCGQLVLYLGNHGCTGAKKALVVKVAEAKLRAPQPSKPPSPKPPTPPKGVHEPKIVPLMSEDDGIVPLTTERPKVTQPQARPKWKGPLSTERVKRYRELNKDAWHEAHAAYMRHYRKHGPKHGV